MSRTGQAGFFPSPRTDNLRAQAQQRRKYASRAESVLGAEAHDGCISEKTSGRWKPGEIESVSLEDIRVGSPARVLEKLFRLSSAI
jgi:hypothetical protein